MKVSLRTWIENYEKGEYSPCSDEEVFNKMCDAGWYDWFCSNKSLVSRIKKFYSIAKKITNEYLLDNFYVWFENNCPLEGPLYDDMRFEPFDEEKRDNLYFLIAVDCCHYDKKYALVTARCGYKVEFKTDDKKELINYINNLDFSKPFFPSISSWIQSVKEESMNIMDIVDTNMLTTISETSYNIIDILLNVFIILAISSNEEFKNSHYVRLTEINLNNSKTGYDEFTFFDEDNHISIVLRINYPFSFFRKCCEETISFGNDFHKATYNLTQISESYPKEDLKYSLFNVQNNCLSYYYASNNYEDIIEKLNTI